MFTSTVVQAGHTKRFTIITREAGWEAREEHDSELVRSAIYTDWHRVERAIEAFQARQETKTTSGVVLRNT